MPWFDVTAIGGDGVWVVFKREAADRMCLERELAAAGYTQVSVLAAAPAPAPMPAKARLSAAGARELGRHVAGLATAGLPMAQGLEALADDLPDRKLAASLGDLAAALRGGESLSQAVDRVAPRLPLPLSELVRAGEQTGALGEMLQAYLERLQRNAESKDRIWLSLSYPLVLAAALFLLMTLLNKVVIVPFRDIFADFGIDVPWLTRMFLRVADWFDVSLVWVLTAPVLALVMVWLSGRLLLEPASRRWLWNHLPLVGPVWQMLGRAEFSQCLSFLLGHGMRLPQAIELAARSSGDPVLVERAVDMAARVSGGAPFAESAIRHGIYPPRFQRLVSWGETQQTLPETLDMIAAILAAEADGRSRMTGFILALVLLILLFVGVALLVIALFLPLFTLLSALSS